MKFPFFKISLMKCMLRARLCILLAFSLCFFSVQSLAIDDSEYIDSVAFDSGLDASALSMMVSGLNASGASSGNITNDVASILALLQSSSVSFGGVRIRTTEYPFANQNMNLGRVLNVLFSSASNPGVGPLAGDSYLYQILELLKNSTYTNDLSDVLNYLMALDGDLAAMHLMQDGSFDAILNYLYTSSTNDWYSEFRYSSGLWHSHLDDSQLYDILSAIQSLQLSVDDINLDNWSPFDDSAWQYAQDNLSMDLSEILDRLSQININLESIDTTSFGISNLVDCIDNDFHYLNSHLSTNVSAGSLSGYVDGAMQETGDDNVPTQRISSLTIQKEDVGNLDDVLELVDSDSLSGLAPSLTGSDASLSMTVVDSTINLDLSLPSDVASFIRTIVSWLWRLILFAMIWRLIDQEYGYWSSLGSGGQ